MAIAAGDILNFAYTGAVQKLTLPPGKYKLEVWGAQGGYRSSATYGGKGGYSVGTISLNKDAPVDTDLFIYVGGSGNSVSAATSSIYPGGFNGGGYRYGYKGGGGASDIRIGKDSLYARVIVAGGGGSDGAPAKKGMQGGGTSGGAATESYGSYGYGGTQTGHTTTVTMPSTQPTANGSGNYPGGFGFGGFGIYRSSGYGGAGGGGWYGGCGSYPDGSGDDDRGGGGGSGFVWTGSNAPSGYLLGAEHYLTDAKTIAGNASMPSTSGSTETGHSGNGYARITCIEVYKFAPDAPADLSAKSTQSAVSLFWSASEGATGYKVYRDGSLLATVTGTSYTDSGLSPGTQHTYGVLAYDSNGESEQSTVTVSTLAWTVTGLKQTVKSTQSLTLSWNADSLASGWKVYKDGVLVATVTVNSYTESGLLPDEEHVYKVVAYNANTESEPASIKAKTEWAWYIQGPKILSITLSPSQTTINASVDVSVVVDEVLLIAENMHSGELFAGEV